MKRILFFFSFILGILSGVVGQNILFVGNSYTAVNNLPEMVYRMGLSTGDTLHYTMNAPGGCTFQQHITQSASYIQQSGWDYVVLQEQSQLPSFPASQFLAESYPFAQQLCQMIRQYNPEAQIIFYMTWGRENGDQENDQFFPPLGTYEGMDSLLFERYMMMAQDNHTCVSPVGAVWHYLRDNHPDIQLYQSDGSHPSVAGTYAAACSFYTLIFHKNPTDIHYDAELEADMAATIRHAAQTIVYDSLSKWCFSITPSDTNNDTLPHGDSVGVRDYISSDLNLFPNPATDFLEVSFSNWTCVQSIAIYTIVGKRVKKIVPTGKQVYTLDVRDLPAGSYFLTLYLKDGQKIIRQFIKHR